MDERDEIAELFGNSGRSRSGAYAEEIRNDDVPPSASTGKPAPAPKPVKLRPPENVEPHPLERPAPRPAAPRPAPEATVADAEFLVGDEDLPDFSPTDFAPPGGSRVAAATKTPPAAAPREEPRKQVPAAAPPAAEAKPAAAAEAPRPLHMTHGEGTGASIAFASDAALDRDNAEGALLQTRGLVKIYDGRTVVNGVDIHVRPGEIVGLLGPNGAGKTTSFYMIVGLVPPNGGEVVFDGNDVTHMPMFKRARLGMGYLPQEESIFRKMTVEENLLAVLETLGLSRKERLARCQELLERFSITHIRKNVALTCSGGEKRRLTIARSLVTMPSLLMLDEPFSGVDPIAVNEIQGIVEDLRRSGLAILITDHNARQTLELVDRAYLIYEGRVLREGTRDFLINDPVSRELYLGDRFTM